jgi:flavodoxin
MKRIAEILTFIVLIPAFSACGNGTASGKSAVSSSHEIAQRTDSTGLLQGTKDMNASSGVLIAYFSRAGENYNVGYIKKGNTEIVAEMIAEQTGGTLFQIQPVTPYPESYEDAKAVAAQELEDNARPAMINRVENMDDYDTVFLGYPIWHGTSPMIINSFLESHNLAGKTIIPFCTHEGSGFGQSVSNIKDQYPESTFWDGIAIRGSKAGSATKSVTDWLNKLDITLNIKHQLSGGKK